MTDLEFDVLDELYFVISFSQLQDVLGMKEETLKRALISLFDKGWIKCFINASEEAHQDEIDIDHHYNKYFYLASKTGLLAHHGRL